MSKKYSGKDCAYCRATEASDSADHVIPLELFSPEHRENKPKVPSCQRCNNAKSALEGEVLTTLLAGSQAENADTYRKSSVRPRLAKNARARRQMGLGEPPVLMMVNSIIRPMHALRIDAETVTKLVSMIALGLYHFHFGRPLSLKFEPQAALLDPTKIDVVAAALMEMFPTSSKSVGQSWGGEFEYAGMRSMHHEDLTIWRMRLHRVALYGVGAPAQGADTWQVLTFPTDSALAGIENLNEL